MTPAERAIQIGCESVTQVARDSGVPRRTLYDYFKRIPFVYDAICFHTLRTSIEVRAANKESEEWLKEQMRGNKDA